MLNGLFVFSKRIGFYKSLLGEGVEVNNQFDFIHVFSRKEALETGVLIDVSNLASEAGVKYPIAMTCAVWERLVEPDAIALNNGESTSGRLWDILFVFALAARRFEGSTMSFPVCCTINGRTETFSLKAVIGPNDYNDPSPAITIMLPDED
jgi:hypothetical protein